VFLSAREDMEHVKKSLQDQIEKNRVERLIVEENRTKKLMITGSGGSQSVPQRH